MENYNNTLDEALNENPELAEQLATMETQYSELQERMLSDEEFKHLSLKFSAMANGLGKALVKKLYENHKEDGNMFPIIMGFMSAKALASNLPKLVVPAMLEGNDTSLILTLAKVMTIPLHSEYYDSFQKEEIEESLKDL